ncbi:hypothetical protein JOF56_002461 [Kibdelosporangium banguiense]|uniref:DUF5642 domain-containing protein n=1 Tax=Kibdelosporangium banguiense TaxID=1365924 RepID=A0ABS4TE06_9PSEU|nr:hypothetical protein [Kibdelosporangium banguiense]MBP2322076.1 hypothetical protein [Kibdelosporangium banguiense]
MSEQEFRDGLKLAVADEPPMKFDLDELVDTAERLARRRRALIAVGASTAAVAVTAVMIPVVLGISGGSAELPMAAPPSSAAPFPSSPAKTAPPTKPPLTRDQLITRGTQMQEYLRTQVPVVVPEAKELKIGVFQGEAEGAVADGQKYLGSFATFRLGAKTAVEIHVQNDQENVDRTCDSCQPRPQQDGSLVVIEQVRTPEGNSTQMRIVSAIHFRNDGTLVRITTYNYDPTSGTEPVYQPDVALTVDQITRLATDPALHL